MRRCTSADRDFSPYQKRVIKMIEMDKKPIEKDRDAFIERLELLHVELLSSGFFFAAGKVSEALNNLKNTRAAK